MNIPQDGEVVHRGLAELGVKTLVIRDAAAPLPGQLTADQEAEQAWQEMSRQIGDAWQNPGPVKPPARPLAKAPPDADPAGQAHDAMVADMMDAWRTVR